jgi:hypothetical protein
MLPETTRAMLTTIGDFAAWYAPLIGMFVFFYRATKSMDDRIDETIRTTNQRIDETIRSGNERADKLHHEFIDLLKELRRDKK